VRYFQSIFNLHARKSLLQIVIKVRQSQWAITIQLLKAYKNFKETTTTFNQYTILFMQYPIPFKNINPARRINCIARGSLTMYTSLIYSH